MSNMGGKLTQQTVKPYYQDESVTIYHGDCLEIMPELEPVDLVLTDPPYGMDFQSNHRRIKHTKIVGDKCFPVEAISELEKIATRAVYVFCRWDNLGDLPKPKSVLAWVKNNWSMGDLKHEHGRQWEAICFYPQQDHEFITRIPDVIHAVRTGNDEHPTQKPTAVLSTIINANVGRLILDPFMGSGTTLRAAKDLGRKAIGIEIEEKYCEIAANRCKQEVMDFGAQEW